MTINWNSVKRADVLQAINKFNLSNDSFPEAKNTFLIYSGAKYPAKHIRGMAYEYANKKEIKKSDYSGGKETVDFFFDLNFDVEYRGKIYSKKNKEVENKLIARLVVTGKQYDKYGRPIYKKLERVLEVFLNKVYKKQHFEFLLTPGGFLHFYFTESLWDSLDVNNIHGKQVDILYWEASKV